MGVVMRIEGRGRVIGCKRGRGGLADNGRARQLQHHHHRRIGSRPKAPIDGRTHFGRKVAGFDDVLDADRDAAQRAGRLRGRSSGKAGKSTDCLLMRCDRLAGQRQRFIWRKLALVDTKSKFCK
jgi:hypothetical protein